MSRIDVRQAAKTLGGRVERADRIRVPGPNDKKRGRNDDSLMVFFGDDKPEGYEVYSHSGDDWRECRDYVRDRLGLPSWKPDDKPRAVFVADEFIYEKANGFPYHRIDLMSDGTYKHFWFEADGWDEKQPPMLIPFALPDMQSDETIWLVRGEDNARLIRDGFNQVATTFPSGINEQPDASFLYHFSGKDVRVLHVGGAESRKFCATFSEALRVPVWSLPGGVPSLRSLARTEGASLDDCTVDEFAPVPPSSAAEHVPDPERPRRVKFSKYTPRDPKSIPPRQWLLGTHLIRKFVSLTVSPGGLGKSSLALVEALSMATGQELLPDMKIYGDKPLRVQYWNGEDPQEENDRRIEAAIISYGIKQESLIDTFGSDSGREQSMILARMVKGDIEIDEEFFIDLENEMIESGTDVLVLDPFVSTHEVNENDNSAIDAVVKRLGKLADRTNAAIELVHHVRKPSAGTKDQTDVNDARGAGALLGGVRSARVLNVMSEDIAEDVGVPSDIRKRHFSVSDGKANMSPTASDVRWRFIENVNLENPDSVYEKGDGVGVVRYFKLPEMQIEATNNLSNIEPVILEILSVNDMTRHWGGRNNPPSGWLGKAVIERMGLVDVSNGQINRVIKGMLNDKKIVIRTASDGRNDVACYTLPGGAVPATVTPTRPDVWDDDAPF